MFYQIQEVYDNRHKIKFNMVDLGKNDDEWWRIAIMDDKIKYVFK